MISASDEVRGRSAASASNNKWVILGITAIGVFMATLDASIVNISLPKISLAFDVPLSGMIEWVIISYLIVLASLLLTFGRLSDIVGQKVLWASGLIVFTVSSALCGAAPSLPLLVVFRAVQGIGGAMMMAISPAMTTGAFPPTQRGRALGIIAAVVAVGTSAGPTVGGIITEALTWRWIFYINVPIGLVGIYATLRYLPERERGPRGEQGFDPVGAVLLSAGTACLMLGMSFGEEAGWSSTLIVGLFAAAFVLFAAFIITETRVAHPIVRLSILRNRVLSSALVSSFLSFTSLFAVMFLMPFYLEELLAMPTDRAGLLLTAVPITIGVVAPVSGALSDRFGSQVLSSLGLAIASLGLWLLSNLMPRASEFDIVWRLVVAGFGQALFQSPNNNAIMGSVPLRQLGVVSGLLATIRTLGQGFSVALTGAIFMSLGGASAGAMLVRKAVAPAGQLESTFIHAFHTALFTCMVIASVGVFTALTRGPAKSRKDEEDFGQSP